MPQHNLSPYLPSHGGRPIHQFTSGLAMDAFVATIGIGCIVELFGSVTLARIGLFECAQVSPSIKYRQLTKLDLRQSSAGVELDGVVKFRAIGTGSLPDWSLSTPGDDNTGGPVFVPTGTFVLDGLAVMDGKDDLKVAAEIYLHTLFASVTNNNVYVGYFSDSAPTLVHTSGHGKSASGWANTSYADQAVNLPVPVFNTNFAGAPDLLTHYNLNAESHSYGTGLLQLYGGMVSDTRTGINGIRTAAHTLPSRTNLIPAFGIVGDGSRIHLNTISCLGN